MSCSCPDDYSNLVQRVACLEAKTTRQDAQIVALTERTNFIWCKLEPLLDLPDRVEANEEWITLNDPTVQQFEDCGLIGDCDSSASGSASISASAS